MVRWLRWHCPPDTGFEIRALAVWGRARYLSVTEAARNTDFHTWMGKKHFCFFQTAESGNRTPNSGVKGSGANHYPRAPALLVNKAILFVTVNCNQLAIIAPSLYLFCQKFMMTSTQGISRDSPVHVCMFIFMAVIYIANIMSELSLMI